MSSLGSAQSSYRAELGRKEGRVLMRPSQEFQFNQEVLHSTPAANTEYHFYLDASWSAADKATAESKISFSFCAVYILSEFSVQLLVMVALCTEIRP